MNVLIDTSVWSLVLRRKPRDLSSHETTIAAEVAELIQEQRVRLIGVIRQEALSGIRSSDQYERLRLRLRNYDDEPLTTDDFEAAAKAYNECRAQGVVSSAIDTLICAIAIRRQWSIFTTDPDFNRYAQVLSIQLHKSRTTIH